MIILSYTTLNNIHKFPCWYFNTKVMGMKEPENEYMIKGKESHKKFQELKKLPYDLDFPSREVHFRKSHNAKYLFHGYADAVNYKSKSLLELKTVNKTLWTNSRMDASIQPIYYSWISGFQKVFLLTSHFNLDFPIPPFYREYTQADWKRAEKWAIEGIKIIETTDYKTLTCDGSCPLGQDCFIYGNPGDTKNA